MKINKYFKEVCIVCRGNILIGQLVNECGNCNSICHIKCAKKSNYRTFRNKMYCSGCISSQDIIHYNPFFDILEHESDSFFDNEPTEYIESIQELSEILENCKSYGKDQFNDMAQKIELEHKNKNSLFSTYFYNIDGNSTNFDLHRASLNILKHKFSIIALAETNVDETQKGLYKLSNEYESVYSSKISKKVKGTGLAIYKKNEYSYTVLHKLSLCNDNIESLFIKNNQFN